MSETVCKTRQDAELGNRKKPHYYPSTKHRQFERAGPYFSGCIGLLCHFEARIDWATWGDATKLTIERKLEG